jgi:hypothetical protein
MFGREKAEFNPELKALPENAAEYPAITSTPEGKDERLEIAAGLLRIIDSVEQGN